MGRVPEEESLRPDGSGREDIELDAVAMQALQCIECVVVHVRLEEPLAIAAFPDQALQGLERPVLAVALGPGDQGRRELLERRVLASRLLPTSTMPESTTSVPTSSTQATQYRN